MCANQSQRLLQAKPVAFLAIKPTVSSFAEQQPHYDPRRTKTFRKDLDVLNEWTKRIEKTGHPAPANMRITTHGPHYAVPYATWTSPFSCEPQRSRDVWEIVLTNQMDPGRLLHAFVCRGSLTLSDDQLLVLPPGTPAETLACWLADLSGTSHVVVKWSDLDKTKFEHKCGKALLKRLGQHPLPTNFVVRDPTAAHRPLLTAISTTSPTLSSASPPPYSLDNSGGLVTRNNPFSLLAVELPTERDPVELAPITTPATPHQTHHTTAFPSTQTAGEHLSATLNRSSTALTSPTSIHRKPTPTTRHLSMLVATPASSHLPSRPASSGAQIPAILTPGPSAAVSPAVLMPRAPSPSSTALPYPLSPAEREAQRAAGSSCQSHSSEIAGRQKLEVQVNPVELPVQTDLQELVAMGSSANAHFLESTSPSIILSQPSDSGTKPESTGSEAAHTINKPSESSCDTYLQLLNRVASGNLSPQALSQLLQSKPS